MLNTPSQMLLVMLAGWVNEQHRAGNAYLREENRVLRELHGKKRLRFTDDQRRRLAAKGKPVGRRVLREFGSIVTPDTILRWHRELIASCSKTQPKVKSRACSRLARQPVYRFWPTCDVLELMS